jgi:hypothetical protein
MIYLDPENKPSLFLLLDTVVTRSREIAAFLAARQ